MNVYQVIVAVMMGTGLLIQSVGTALNPKISSGAVALSILMDISIKAVYVVLLHLGGFW